MRPSTIARVVFGAALIAFLVGGSFVPMHSTDVWPLPSDTVLSLAVVVLVIYIVGFMAAILGFVALLLAAVGEFD